MIAASRECFSANHSTIGKECNIIITSQHHRFTFVVILCFGDSIDFVRHSQIPRSFEHCFCFNRLFAPLRPSSSSCGCGWKCGVWWDGAPAAGIARPLTSSNGIVLFHFYINRSTTEQQSRNVCCKLKCRTYSLLVYKLCI